MQFWPLVEYLCFIGVAHNEELQIFILGYSYSYHILDIVISCNFQIVLNQNDYLQAEMILLTEKISTLNATRQILFVMKYNIQN